VLEKLESLIETKESIIFFRTQGGGEEEFNGIDTSELRKLIADVRDNEA
jgi:hypothetical protein